VRVAAVKCFRDQQRRSARYQGPHLDWHVVCLLGSWPGSSPSCRPLGFQLVWRVYLLLAFCLVVVGMGWSACNLLASSFLRTSQACSFDALSSGLLTQDFFRNSHSSTVLHLCNKQSQPKNTSLIDDAVLLICCASSPLRPCLDPPLQLKFRSSPIKV
jgi:hypothetical protein